MNRVAITLQLIGPYLPPHKLYFKNSKLTWPYSSFSTEKQLNLEEGKKNYYRVLGVKSSSSFQQIKSQYLQCSKKYHPDVLKAIAKTQKQELLKSDQNLSSKFVEIQEAFKTLSNSRTRRLHDLQIGIQDSLWIRQQFYGRSQHLQNEQFNKILNLNISMENIQVGMNMRQRLMVKYASQLQQPSIKDYIKGHNGNLTKYLSKYQYTDQRPLLPSEGDGVSRNKVKGSIVDQKGMRPIIITQPSERDDAGRRMPKSPSGDNYKSPRSEKSNKKQAKDQKDNSNDKNREPKSPQHQKSPHINEDPIGSHLKSLAKQSRYLSDTAFRKYFHKQCFENYGRMNTTGAADGVIYNNYMKTHNINPHSGFNQPMSLETYKHALLTGSPEKYLVPGEDYYGDRSSLKKSNHNASKSSRNLKNLSRSDDKDQHFIKEKCDIEEIREESENANRIKEKYKQLHLSTHVKQSREQQTQKEKKRLYGMQQQENQRKKIYSNFEKSHKTKKEQALLQQNTASRKQVKFHQYQPQQVITDQNQFHMHSHYQPSNSYTPAKRSTYNDLRNQEPQILVNLRKDYQNKESLFEQESSIPVYEPDKQRSLGIKKVESDYRITADPNLSLGSQHIQHQHIRDEVCPNCRGKIQTHRNLEAYNYRMRRDFSANVKQYQSRQKQYHANRKRNEHQTCCCHMNEMHQCKCCMERIKDIIVERASQDGQLAARLLSSAKKFGMYNDYPLKRENHGQ